MTKIVTFHADCLIPSFALGIRKSLNSLQNHDLFTIRRPLACGLQLFRRELEKLKTSKLVKRGKSTMAIFKLVSKNLSDLGGPMGTDRTRDNWTKHFDNVQSAKDYVAKDYKGTRTLTWLEWEGGYRTNDLGYVMYYISPIEIEK